MTADGWTGLLLAASALHAGFQLTVTVLVYPALVRVPADRWTDAHTRHSRAIVPLVALAYGAALAACAGATVHAFGPGVLTADVGTLVAVVVTATLAAPTHARLTAGPDPALLRRLLRVDRVRCAAAVVALAGALVALVAATA